jgi:DNA-binding transcriptional ArsR family regulator
MSFEEDTYTTIFKAMQHPIRRRILRMISEKPSTYTEIQRDLNIDNGLLNYHLEALSSLITKNGEEKYTLSDFGRATAGLIKGVEEPNREVKSTSTPPIMKILTAVLVVALIVSGVGLIELNNRYLDLSGRYNTQTVEKNYLQSALTASEASLSRMNSTLTTLEKNSLVKASTMIIDRVGIDYFNTYFHGPTVTTNIYNLPNVTKVNYLYRIELEGYVVDRNVTFYFHPTYVMQYGLPVEGNLQPFKITKDEAIRLALEAGLPDNKYGLEASIWRDGSTDILPLSPSADKYVWEITSWEDPTWARTRTFAFAQVDPITGEVYKSNGRGGGGLVVSGGHRGEGRCSGSRWLC